MDDANYGINNQPWEEREFGEARVLAIKEIFLASTHIVNCIGKVQNLYSMTGRSEHEQKHEDGRKEERNNGVRRAFCVICAHALHTLASRTYKYDLKYDQNQQSAENRFRDCNANHNYWKWSPG